MCVCVGGGGGCVRACVCACVRACDVCGLEEGGGRKKGLTFVFLFTRWPVNGACTQPFGRLQIPSV